MIKQPITIINKLGLHARAAAKFVSTASKFSSQIKICKDNQLVDGKSIISVMMLAAAQGCKLDLIIEGEDENNALLAITQLIDNRFDEDE